MRIYVREHYPSLSTVLIVGEWMVMSLPDDWIEIGVTDTDVVEAAATATAAGGNERTERKWARAYYICYNTLERRMHLPTELTFKFDVVVFLDPLQVTTQILLKVAYPKQVNRFIYCV